MVVFAGPGLLVDNSRRRAGVGEESDFADAGELSGLGGAGPVRFRVAEGLEVSWAEGESRAAVGDLTEEGAELCWFAAAC